MYPVLRTLQNTKIGVAKDDGSSNLRIVKIFFSSNLDVGMTQVFL